MMGVKDGDPDHRGIIPNAFEHIFGFIDDCQKTNMKFLVRCSYLEIYNEDIRDLLNSKQNLENKLELKEDPNRGGVYVKDLTCCIVKSIPEIEKLMSYGTSQRKTGETAMNKDSSRSHSIFTIYIETSETVIFSHLIILGLWRRIQNKSWKIKSSRFSWLREII